MSSSTGSDAALGARQDHRRRPRPAARARLQPLTRTARVPEVLVPASRWERWLANFRDRHGETHLEVAGGALRGRRSTVRRSSPACPSRGRTPARPRVSPVGPAGRLGRSPGPQGRLRGGPDGRRDDDRPQGRPASRRVAPRPAGRANSGSARRRANQARQAFDAAAEHAVRLLGEAAELPVVVGGDRDAIEQVLGERGLTVLRPVGPWLAVPDPRRAVLDQAVLDAQALVVEVHNA
ncbi:Vms1/Ankzf1 family peptidyl-tRNA hydrolase [Nocardioides sp.]|uniref:Vms1/Ankzf1 family peptidyl-tRNA hydrolase n=1 Tax=Nocardioides sp. TaxID=35761 RepID=UPI003528DB23